MDVPYNKSGASSRAHYQLVRAVENGNEDVETLLSRKVERIRLDLARKAPTTADLEKDLIILMYCVNTSSRARMRETISFALPHAARLAEAGSTISQKSIGYLFCSGMMPPGHELQLMLVNTIRKDLFSPVINRMAMALEYLISSPSMDQIPAVQSRCTELLSHPSPRLKVLAIKSICSLSSVAPELLLEDEIQRLIQERLNDADEAVIRAALRASMCMWEAGFLRRERVAEYCLMFVFRLVDKSFARRTSVGFKHIVLSFVQRLYADKHSFQEAEEKQLLDAVFVILRRSVKYNNSSTILDCFHILGSVSPSTVAKFIKDRDNDQQSNDDVHPIARIRHLISSRELSDIYLFLSCLSLLHPSLWAGEQVADVQLLSEGESQSGSSQTLSIKPVLDQWEVEKIISSLESDDEKIREMTLAILTALDAGLTESCYSQVLGAIRTRVGDSGQKQVPKPLLRRALEIVLVGSLRNQRLSPQERAAELYRRLNEVVIVVGSEKLLPIVVEMIISHVRKEDEGVQRAVIVELATTENPIANITISLSTLALTCELASSLRSKHKTVLEVVTCVANHVNLQKYPVRELTMLTIIRLSMLLTPAETSTLRVVSEGVRTKMNESANEPTAASFIRRCSQLLAVLNDPIAFASLCAHDEHLSLPELAIRLDRGLSVQPAASPTRSLKPSSVPSGNTPPPSSGSSSTSLGHSKLRYDAYAPPPTSPSNRTSRLHYPPSSGSASRTSSGTSRRLSDGSDNPLSQTVTPGELTLAVASGLKDPSLKSPKRTVTHSLAPVLQRQASNLISLDSPFLSEPLVDAGVTSEALSDPKATSPTGLSQSMHSTQTSTGTTDPYVSASTSLHTSQELGASAGAKFAELWDALDGVKARGWSDDAVEAVLRRLQGNEMQMDVVDCDDDPFKGDLKVTLSPRDSEGLCLVRLHEEADGTCLWQLRGNDEALAKQLKSML